MITVLGSINMDLIARVARLPNPGETLPGEHFWTAAGGKGANQALAATRAGATVAMAGAVGRDAFASETLALLKEAGCNLAQVRSIGGPTGTAVILVDGSGENVIVVIAGANATVTPDDAKAAIGHMSRGDILLLQLEIPAETVEAALQAARAAGVTSILNTAPLTADAERLAAMADIVIANETEFARLSGEDQLSGDELGAALQGLHAQREQTLVVTLGAAGVVAVREGKTIAVKGLRITPVDTVGAGDTFCGYLAAGLDAGIAFEQALHRATVAGSLACLKSGAQPSIPVALEVDGAMAQPSF